MESKAWAKEKILLDKGFLKRLADMHTPTILCIESSDSLIPAREVTNTEPGEILVYRNMASQVRADDLNFMAVLEDALFVSNIDIIIVCGYSHCSGVRNVLMGHSDRPYARQWLSELTALYEMHQHELNHLEFETKERRLSELNIKQQIVNLSELELIQRSWEQRKAPVLLGWYFDLDTGELSEVFTMEPHNELKQVSSVE